jgi:copper resistance protein B
MLVAAGLAAPSSAAEEMPSTADRPAHGESARHHEGEPPPAHEGEPPPAHEGEPPPAPETPPLPEGMSLDDVLERAAQSPPEHYPDPVPDDALRTFVLAEQIEYRLGVGERDQLGWEAQGWIGYDYDRFWWKSEGEAVFDGPDEGESETDLLYSRLITPFWSIQAGVQYAIEWEPGDTSDRWSGVVALQGLAPGMVELDASLYVSEDADVTVEIEGEYDLRLTQRLVLQPRIELGLSAQDVPERNLGAGLTDANLDLRLRYEVKRELAPYMGLRYRLLVGETGNRAEDAGLDDDQLFFFAGLRLAF